MFKPTLILFYSMVCLLSYPLVALAQLTVDKNTIDLWEEVKTPKYGMIICQSAPTKEGYNAGYMLDPSFCRVGSSKKKQAQGMHKIKGFYTTIQKLYQSGWEVIDSFPIKSGTRRYLLSKARR